MTQKVCFAIPTITGDIRCETAIALTEAIIICRAAGIETDFIVLANCPVLPVARNTLEAMFMSDPEATDFFFIDYDVKFNAEAVLKLLERPEEIIAGAYRVKVDDKEEYSVVIKEENGVPVGKVISQDPPLALIQAEFLATGFMRIKRTALQKMRDAYPNLRYEESVVRTTNRKIDTAYDLFGMGIDDTRGRYTTEDYMFCKRWRDIGGELWIYPDIDFDHIGRKAYSGNFHQHLMSLPGGGKHENQGIAKAMHIDGWMLPLELIWLSAQAKLHKSIVEIGSFLGRSTRALADSTEGTVLAVDPWDGEGEVEKNLDCKLDPAGMYLRFRENMAGCENLKTIQAKSQDAVKTLCGAQFDMIFIDGAHDYENVKADIQEWGKLLTPSGLLCGHDYDLAGVKQAVDELLPGASIVPGTRTWFWRAK